MIISEKEPTLFFKVGSFLYNRLMFHNKHSFLFFNSLSIGNLYTKIDF